MIILRELPIHAVLGTVPVPQELPACLEKRREIAPQWYKPKALRLRSAISIADAMTSSATPRSFAGRCEAALSRRSVGGHSNVRWRSVLRYCQDHLLVWSAAGD